LSYKDFQLLNKNLGFRRALPPLKTLKNEENKHGAPHIFMARIYCQL
jgi:hypothetical protein